jgi:hypothetical protein
MPREPLEPFVDAARAAEFLSLKPRRVLELARRGEFPAHPLGHSLRRIWRFRLSELAAAMEQRSTGAAGLRNSRDELPYVATQEAGGEQ